MRPATADRILILAVTALAAACGLAPLAGCHGQAPRSEFGRGENVLRIATSDDIPTLDPAVGYDSQSWEFEQMIFDTLVRYADDSADLQPGLATKWQVSADGRVYTFHLRRDVRFTNGRPVTSADVRFGVERVLDPRTRSRGSQYYRSLAGSADFIAHRAEHVAGIETPDPWTITFCLASPDPIFIHKLAMPFAAAVPREIVTRWGEDFSHHAVGSGPFRLDQWVSGQRIVLLRNPDYFVRERPRVDAIVELLGVNDQLEWLKYEAGEIDISLIPSAEFAYVMKNPRLKAQTVSTVTARTNYLGMNCQMAPFNDVRVRRAFNYAINRAKIVALLNGRAVAARGILPPGFPGYDPSLEGYPYDPDKARRLLEHAGVGAGFAPTLWIRADQEALILGQSIQQDLAVAGVSLVLKPVAWGPLLEAIRQPDTAPLFMLGWEADFPDPENFLEILLSRKQWGSNNDSFYENPEVERLLDEAAPITNLSKRYALYRKAERIVINDAPWVCLVNPVEYAIRQPWVRDFVLNPIRPPRLDRVWLSRTLRE